MSTCIRCGMSAHEYGPDGLSYCTNCMFYGMNKQCWKCRMYLPVTELQTYRGQLTCQYCIMDLRDETKRIEEREDKKQKKDDYESERRLYERCERCGRELNIVYNINGKKLCASCAEDEKKQWGGQGSERPAIGMIRIREENNIRSKIVSIVTKKKNEFIAWIGGLIRERDIKNKKSEREKERKAPFKLMTISGAEPLFEKKLDKEKEKKDEIMALRLKKHIRSEIPIKPMTEARISKPRKRKKD